MKENYQKILEETIKKLNKTTPSLLLHSCCAPCSSYVLEYLSNYFKITVLYYNPNIAPIDEYNQRLEEMKKFIKEFKGENKIELIEGKYNNEDFVNMSKGLEEDIEGGERCKKCYYMRLEEAAKLATNNFDYFTTTLSISPLKDSQILNKMGKILANKYNVKYLYSDFKKKEGYKRSTELSKIYNLYRQNYCGCIYSKQQQKNYSNE
ncbi:MAG: epoxyqueuosine reductase QueH [Bacilli bacterium]